MQIPSHLYPRLALICIISNVMQRWLDEYSISKEEDKVGLCTRVLGI